MLVPKRKTCPGSFEVAVTGRWSLLRPYSQERTPTDLSSWEFPKLAGPCMREAVFFFSSECGEVEKTEAEMWK